MWKLLVCGFAGVVAGLSAQGRAPRPPTAVAFMLDNVVLVGGAAADKNIVRNGAFEEWSVVNAEIVPDVWKVAGSPVFSLPSKPSSGLAVLVRATKGGDLGVYQDQIPVTPLTVYTLQFDYRIVEGSEIAVRVDDRGANLLQVGVRGEINQWIHFQRTVKSSQRPGFMTVYFRSQP